MVVVGLGASSWGFLGGDVRWLTKSCSVVVSASCGGGGGDSGIDERVRLLVFVCVFLWRGSNDIHYFPFIDKGKMGIDPKFSFSQLHFDHFSIICSNDILM